MRSTDHDLKTLIAYASQHSGLGQQIAGLLTVARYCRPWSDKDNYIKVKGNKVYISEQAVREYGAIAGHASPSAYVASLRAMAKQNTELAGIMAWKEAGPVDGQPCCIIDCDLLQQLTAAEGTSTLQHVNMQQHRVAGPATAAIEISVVPSHSGSLSQLQQGPAGVFSSAAVRLSDASFSSSAMGSPQQHASSPTPASAEAPTGVAGHHSPTSSSTASPAVPLQQYMAAGSSPTTAHKTGVSMSHTPSPTKSRLHLTTRAADDSAYHYQQKPLQAGMCPHEPSVTSRSMLSLPSPHTAVSAAGQGAADDDDDDDEDYFLLEFSKAASTWRIIQQAAAEHEGLGTASEEPSGIATNSTSTSSAMQQLPPTATSVTTASASLAEQLSALGLEAATAQCTENPPGTHLGMASRSGPAEPAASALAVTSSMSAPEAAASTLAPAAAGTSASVLAGALNSSDSSGFRPDSAAAAVPYSPPRIATVQEPSSPRLPVSPSGSPVAGSRIVTVMRGGGSSPQQRLVMQKQLAEQLKLASSNDAQAGVMASMCHILGVRQPMELLLSQTSVMWVVSRELERDGLPSFAQVLQFFHAARTLAAHLLATANLPELRKVIGELPTDPLPAAPPEAAQLLQWLEQQQQGPHEVVQINESAASAAAVSAAVRMLEKQLFWPSLKNWTTDPSINARFTVQMVQGCLDMAVSKGLTDAVKCMTNTAIPAVQQLSTSFLLGLLRRAASRAPADLVKHLAGVVVKRVGAGDCNSKEVADTLTWAVQLLDEYTSNRITAGPTAATAGQQQAPTAAVAGHQEASASAAAQGLTEQHAAAAAKAERERQMKVMSAMKVFALELITVAHKTAKKPDDLPPLLLWVFDTMQQADVTCAAAASPSAAAADKAQQLRAESMKSLAASAESLAHRLMQVPAAVVRDPAVLAEVLKQALEPANHQRHGQHQTTFDAAAAVVDSLLKNSPATGRLTADQLCQLLVRAMEVGLVGPFQLLCAVPAAKHLNPGHMGQLKSSSSSRSDLAQAALTAFHQHWQGGYGHKQQQQQQQLQGTGRGSPRAADLLHQHYQQQQAGKGSPGRGLPRAGGLGGLMPLAREHKQQHGPGDSQGLTQGSAMGADALLQQQEHGRDSPIRHSPKAASTSQEQGKASPGTGSPKVRGLLQQQQEQQGGARGSPRAPGQRQQRVGGWGRNFIHQYVQPQQQQQQQQQQDKAQRKDQA